MNRITEWSRDHQIAAFFILTFLITWGLMFPFSRLYFQSGSDLAAIPMMWGLFGPALAGMIITRVINPRARTGSSKRSLLVFFFGLILSVLVLVGNSWSQGNMVLALDSLIPLLIFYLLLSVPPALVISSVFSPHQSLRSYLGSLIKPRGSIWYYLVALLIHPAGYYLGALITRWLDLTPYYTPPPLTGWDGVLTLGMAFLYQFFYANVLGEEVGWRGFALPRLQARTSPLVASLVISLFWFPWHLPLKLGNPDIIPMVFYALSFIPSSIILTWLYNRTEGSILVVGLAHVVGNLAGKYLFPITDARLAVGFAISVIFIVLDRMWNKLPQNHQGVYQEENMGVRYEYN
jgi:membrane protease YdiL (CAAX protease family)